MTKINLRSVDLNLLVIFEALIEERSVTRAAARLGLTQSAVSHALRRLRITFADELLVRTAKGMEPTPHAGKLAITIRTVLKQIEDVLDVQGGFDPATARRTFHLAISDYIGEFLLPRLCMRLRAQAPDISLSVQYIDEERPSLDARYSGVEVNFSVGGGVTKPVRVERLLKDRLLVLMRPGHPAAAGPLTLETYLSLAHMKVMGVGSSAIDEALAASGLVRRVMVKVPTWQGMLEVIENTDLVAAIPAHWMRSPRFSANCVAAPLPVEGVSLVIDSSWHPRNEGDDGHKWFRGLIRSIFDDLSTGEAGRGKRGAKPRRLAINSARPES